MSTISRRFFLAGVAGCGTAAAFPFGGSPAASPLSATEMWRQAVGEGPAVRELGLHCLRNAAVEGQLEGLMAGLGSAAAAHGWSATGGAGSLRATLRQVQRADFERGDVVRVEGWVLARNEARAYALAALLAGEPAAQAHLFHAS